MERFEIKIKGTEGEKDKKLAHYREITKDYIASYHGSFKQIKGVAKSVILKNYLSIPNCTGYAFGQS